MKKQVLLTLIFFFLASTTCAAAGHLYVVKAGDTLPKIAAQYQTTVQEVKLTNGLPGDRLTPGQKLFVPVMHEVALGDTLESLAEKYHSSEALIRATNKLPNNQLAVGSMLRVNPRKLSMQGTHILMTREEFQDWLLNQAFTRKITLIQQHHTWAPSYKSFNGSNHFRLLTGMENYHKQNMHWKTIAQNITTFPDGKVAVSRDFNMAPEGSIGSRANATGIAIENVGNFDLGKDAMTAEQKETIVTVTALLCLKFGLTPSVYSITYHHWWRYKTGELLLDNSKPYEVKPCPGTNFFGGNTTKAAKTHFYPLITKKMNTIKTTSPQWK